MRIVNRRSILRFASEFIIRIRPHAAVLHMPFVAYVALTCTGDGTSNGRVQYFSISWMRQHRNAAAIISFLSTFFACFYSVQSERARIRCERTARTYLSVNFFRVTCVMAHAINRICVLHIVAARLNAFIFVSCTCCMEHWFRCTQTGRFFGKENVGLGEGKMKFQAHKCIWMACSMLLRVCSWRLHATTLVFSPWSRHRGGDGGWHSI